MVLPRVALVRETFRAGILRSARLPGVPAASVPRFPSRISRVLRCCPVLLSPAGPRRLSRQPPRRAMDSEHANVAQPLLLRQCEDLVPVSLDERVHLLSCLGFSSGHDVTLLSFGAESLKVFYGLKSQGASLRAWCRSSARALWRFRDDPYFGVARTSSVSRSIDQNMR